MTAPPLALFAYAFPHRKTNDFLCELVLKGYRNLCVIAAPWRELKHADSTVYVRTNLRNAPALNTSDICNAFGLRYFELPHEDADGIAALKNEYCFESAIIAGARILKRNVIDLFTEGVVNFHPGKLPETSGLDLFYHTIRSGAPLGVTAHFIDHRVDAGREIFFEETLIGPDDSAADVQYNNYQTQIRALRRLLERSAWSELETLAIARPRANQPMSPDEKREMLVRFPTWRNAQYRAQQIKRLLAACQNGDDVIVSKVLKADQSLLECRSPEGWTPLIVASFHQQAGCVRLLLDFGANPNAAGPNGTTVLMYAKTALLNKLDASPEILKMLIEAGADLSRCDRYGRDIFHYVGLAGDRNLAEWLTLQNARS